LGCAPLSCGARHPIVSGQVAGAWPSVVDMKPVFSFFALALAGLTGMTPTAVAGTHLVTVELFTSQGCSSCPAADEILDTLADRTDLLALTFPVDYWDYLGWRDTLAMPEFTKRQYAYAKSLKTYQPYTPQVVIDGRIDVVGNDETKIGWAVEDRLKRDAEGPPLTVTSDPASIIVSLGSSETADGSGAKHPDATVWLVRYADKETVKVDRGENEDRILHYRHVVRAIMPIGMWSGAPVQIALPRADLQSALGNGGQDQAFAVLVQSTNMGPILSAARLPLP